MLSPFFSEPLLDQIIATVDYSQDEWEQFLQQCRSSASYQTWLRQQGVTPREFELWLRRELAIRKFQQRQWGKQVTSYFLDRKRQLDRVVCSLIYLKDRGQAQELYFRIVEQEATFAELARVYSQGPAATQGGRIGPIELGQIHPQLTRLFYGARPGQVWEPVEIDSWIVIARLDASLPVQFDEVMRQTLLNELLDAWLADRRKPDRQRRL